MSTNSATDGARAAAYSRTRLLGWCIRRELWENRVIVAAPVAVAAIVLFGFLLHIPRLPRDMRATLTLAPADQAMDLMKPFGVAALAIIVTGTLVGLVYCLGALQNERRDRSILFWKSLPVSDTITVLGKVLVPLVVLPLMTGGTLVALHLVLLLLCSAVLLASGVTPAPLWTTLPLAHLDFVLLYALVTLAVWYAPVHAWLLLVSGWARRVAFIWAVLPPLALCLVEKIAFQTSHVAHAFAARLGGSVLAAFAPAPPGERFGSRFPRPDVAGFLATGNLWLGLAMAAVLLAATVWLRRHRGPI